jgi:prepilin-type N-terminal cleavage/methylation domain-containing protein
VSTRGQGRGFSLLELLVVLGLLGVLAALIIPTAAGARVAAQRAQTKARFAQWAVAAELFRQEYGHYPDIATDGKIDATKFAPALLGRLTLAGEPLPSDAGATALRGNVRRLAFLAVTMAELSEDGSELVDAFGNRDLAVRWDRSGDGWIDASDVESGEAWPGVRGQSGSEVAPPPEALLPGGRVAAAIVFYSAGRGERPSDLVLSWQ